MKLFSFENRVKCGRCGTEFDFTKNKACPLCNFGPHTATSAVSSETEVTTNRPNLRAYNQNPLNKPLPHITALPRGQPIIDDYSKLIGTWGMFNTFFSGKAVCRILAHLCVEQKRASLLEVVDATCHAATGFIVNSKSLSKYRGFPRNPKDGASRGRLVWHFIRTFHDMGLIIAHDEKEDRVESLAALPDSNWNKKFLSLSQEGYEFASIPNNIFDLGKDEQVLTVEEKKWLISYLKRIDSEGYREYTVLRNVLFLLKEGKNGKDDLQSWFGTYRPFLDSIKIWSRKAKNGDSGEKQKQIDNLAAMFASSKVALLRELGVVNNKRNDYTILGEL